MTAPAPLSDTRSPRSGQRSGGVDELWGDYWTGAALRGCTDQFPADVQQQLNSGWQHRLGHLGSGDRLLDLGCGRGALLAIARDMGAMARGVVAIGIDSAPSRALAGEGFDIRGGTDAGRTPFPDGAFTLVASQFGVEYAGLRRAVAEAARLASTKVALLTHAAGGIVAQHAAEQRAQVAALVGEHDIAARLGAAIDGGTAAAFDIILGEIAAMAEAAANHSLLEQLYGSLVELRRLALATPQRGELRGAAEFLLAQLTQHAARMGALAQAAPTRAGIDAAADRLQSAGFTTMVSEQRSPRGDLVGYWLDASRNDQP